MKKMIILLLYIIFAVYLMFCTALMIARNKDKRIRRMYDNINIMRCLLELRNNNVTVAEKLGLSKEKKIAIYGNGIIGKQITKQLMLEGIQIVYAVDQLSNVLHYDGIPVYRPDLKLPQVDVMIVTPIDAYSGIKEKLESRMTCRVVSVGDLLRG